MATLKEIKRRIGSVESTQKITKAMKMVAAVRLRKAQENILAARPYAYRLGSLIKHLAEFLHESQVHPLLQSREVKRVMGVIVTADRALCGGFNANIIRTVNGHLDGNLKEVYENNNLDFVAVGRKGHEYFKKRDFNITQSHINIFNQLEFATAVRISDGVTQAFLDGEVDEVYMIYNEFKSAVQQNVVIEKALPIAPAEVESGTERLSSVDYIYEPSRSSIMNTIVPQHLHVQMWRILLESYAAEMGARMTAMEAATENAGELIRKLTLHYNRARQAAITKEILEVVSGAEALQG